MTHVRDICQEADRYPSRSWDEEVAWLRHGISFAEALCLLCWEDLDKCSQAVFRGTFRMCRGVALEPYGEGLEEELAFAVELPVGIVGDLEEVPIEVLEVAAVAAPEDLLGGLDDACPEALGLL